LSVNSLALIVYDGVEAFEMEALETLYYELVEARPEELLELQQARFRLLRRAADSSCWSVMSAGKITAGHTVLSTAAMRELCLSRSGSRVITPLLFKEERGGLFPSPQARTVGISIA